MALWTAFFALSLGLGALPPEGSVDVDALVRADSRWQRVERLRTEAARLRALAAAPAELTWPASPPPERSDVGGAGELRAEDYETKAEAVELQLLREALLDEIAANRQRRLSARSDELAAALRDRQRQTLDSLYGWEHDIARAQVVERTTWTAQLANERLRPDDAERIRRDLSTLDALVGGVAELRRREALVGATRQAREATAAMLAELDRQASEERRRADRELARRELELAAAAAQREAYRRERLGERAALTVDLQLDDWRRELAERPAAAVAQQAAGRETLVAEAEALEAQATALAARLDALLRPRVLAWVTVIQRQDGVTLHTTPADGVPDITAAVAARIAALESDPSAATGGAR